MKPLVRDYLVFERTWCPKDRAIPVDRYGAPFEGKPNPIQIGGFILHPDTARALTRALARKDPAE